MMAIKIDLEKAYNHICSAFIAKPLQELGLPDNLITLIKYVISSCSMQVLWNREMTKVFCHSRGIRQGDPLSLYIFMLYLEKLAHMIKDLVELKVWKLV